MNNKTITFLEPKPMNIKTNYNTNDNIYNNLNTNKYALNSEYTKNLLEKEINKINLLNNKLLTKESKHKHKITQSSVNNSLNEDKSSHYKENLNKFRKDPFKFLNVVVDSYFKNHIDFNNRKSNKEIVNFNKNLKDNITNTDKDNLHKKEINHTLSNEADNKINNSLKITSYNIDTNKNNLLETRQILKDLKLKINKLEDNFNQEKINCSISKNKTLSYVEEVKSSHIEQSKENNLNKELISQPIKCNDLINKLTNQESKNYINIKDFGFKITSKGNIINEILNNPNSNYTNINHNLSKEALSCLKGDKILPPLKTFYKVFDITTKDTPPATELTQNLIDIQKNILKVNNKYDEVILENAKKNIKLEKEMFNDMIENTNICINNIDSKIKDSNEIMTSLFNKLNTDFNKKLIKEGLNQINIVDYNLDNLKNDILKNDQYIEHQKERFNIYRDQNDKITKVVDKFLENKGVELQESSKEETKIVNKSYIENSLISDSVLDRLYEEYKDYDKKIDLINKKTHKKSIIPVGYHNSKGLYQFNNTKKTIVKFERNIKNKRKINKYVKNNRPPFEL